MYKPDAYEPTIAYVALDQPETLTYGLTRLEVNRNHPAQ
jgi:hypothetical protein